MSRPIVCGVDDSNGARDAARVVPAVASDEGAQMLVCGIDGTAESRSAAQVASRLAWTMNNRLVLAHTYRPATTWSDPGQTRRYSWGPLMSQWQAGLKRLEAAASELTELPEPEFSLEAGDPVDELVRMATRERSELLVVGAHERGKLRAAMQGSVGGKLAASAPIPVLVVPSPVAAPSARDDESLHADSQPNAEELRDWG